MGTHKDYEIMRDQDRSFEAKKQAHDRMVVESGKLTHAVGVEELGEPLRIPGPVK